MTRRLVVVFADPGALSEPPPGVEPRAWRRALTEDVGDLAAGLANVDSGGAGPDTEELRGLLWPGSPVYGVGNLTELLVAAADGYDEVVVLAADAPDLPAMLVGKLFRSLGSHAVAVAPADGGGAVALGARLPVPAWLLDAQPDLGTVTAGELRRHAGEPRSVAATPGWHRLRRPEDVHRLDPGLEGWEATRGLLSGAAAQS